MKQYFKAKNQHPGILHYCIIFLFDVIVDHILLFRMGDFFEIFYEDAIQISPVVLLFLIQG